KRAFSGLGMSKKTGRWRVEEWSSRSTRAGRTPESTVKAAKPRPRATTIWDAFRRRGGRVDMQGNVPLASRAHEPGSLRPGRLGRALDDRAPERCCTST